MVSENINLKTAADPAGAERTRNSLYFRPSVDILEKRNELLVVADVPGAAGDDVDIRFDDGTLTIHAKVEPRHEDTEYLLQEYAVGDYWRTFEISEAIDASRISADYADGVLTLHLPKTEALKPRKIEVKKN
jgi:HSP20 family protein